MAKLTIDGREVILAPYKIGAMRRAAPWIDKINARAAAMMAFSAPGTDPATASQGFNLTDLTEMTMEFIEVLAVGTTAADPALDADYLAEHFGVGDLAALRDCYRDVMQESGLGAKGEAKAPPARAPRGASKKA